MLISLIVPCYNEAAALPFLYRELCDVTTKLSDYDFEFLLVNDGSKDDTLAVIKDLAEKDDRIVYLSFARNFGKEAAMYAGFCNAKGDYIAVLDADMQHPPSLIPEMVEILNSGEYDCVAARRESRDGEPKIRSMFSRLFYYIINKISDVNIASGACDFRLMKKQMVEAIVKMSEYNRFSKGIFGWVGFKTHWLPYKNVERIAGNTTWSFWSLFKYSLDGFINFSQAPLQVASVGGIFLTLVSFIMVVFLAVRKIIFGDPVAGWASTICVIIFIGGIQLFCLGIMGQYIAKIYLETKNRPHYIVSETNSEDVIKIQ